MSDNINKRMWILDNMELMLREGRYHRGQEEPEKLPFRSLWTLGCEEPTMLNVTDWPGQDVDTSTESE